MVIHGTVGTNSLGWLTKNPRSVSAHYLIPKDGDVIYRMVDEARGANHAGAATSRFHLNGQTYTGGRVNRATIGIELESLQTGRNDYTDAQLLAMGWLINDVRDRHGPIPLLRHAGLDPTRKRDPINLPHDQLEKWANAAVLVFGSPALVRRYRAIACAPVFQDRRPDSPLALTVSAGTIEEMDDLTGGWLHFESEAGFSPRSCWEAL